MAKIKKAATFNQGFDTTEYLASALMDMRYHTADPQGIDPDAFEKQQLAELGMPDEIVMRHRSPHFSHVFSSEGYSAGYYGYLWADVLTSDAAEAFAQAPGGFYDKAVAKRLVENLFAPRNSIDPADAYRAFRGRDAKIDALMRVPRLPGAVEVGRARRAGVAGAEPALPAACISPHRVGRPRRPPSEITSGPAPRRTAAPALRPAPSRCRRRPPAAASRSRAGSSRAPAASAPGGARG